MRNEYAYLGEDTGLTVLEDGQYCYLDTQDISITPHLIRYGSWEDDVTKVFKETVPENGIVFDVGANVGYYSILAASKGNEVHAFEPIKRYVELLKMSASVNGYNPRIIANNYAVTTRPGETEFNVNHKDTCSSSLTRTWEDEDEYSTIIVDTTSIDIYCSDNGIKAIDYMKIDAEGNEYRILKDTKTPIKQMLLEFNWQIYEGGGKEMMNWIRDRYKSIERIDTDGNRHQVVNNDQVTEDALVMLFLSDLK